jgi:hypothetical protein
MPTPRKKINWKRLCMEKEADILSLRNQIDFLVRTIRDMDDKLFSISQCTDWPQMRPRIAALVDEMIARKVNESKAIGRVIEDRLREVYKPEAEALKRITNK